MIRGLLNTKLSIASGRCAHFDEGLSMFKPSKMEFITINYTTIMILLITAA